MNKKIHMIQLSCFALAIQTTSSFANPGLFISSFSNTNAHAAPAPSFSISAAFEKTEYKVGESIPVVLSFKNESGQPLRFRSGGNALSMFGPYITIDGSNVFLTADGTNRALNSLSVNRFETITPGQSLSREIDLSRVYSMTLPGEYHVSFANRASPIATNTVAAYARPATGGAAARAPQRISTVLTLSQ